MTRSIHSTQTRALLLAAVERLADAADDLDAAIDGATEQFDPELSALAAASRAVRVLLGDQPTVADGPAPFDRFEIEPCRRFEEPDQPGCFYYEVCDPSEADVWTLYGRIPDEGVEAIGDFSTKAAAMAVLTRITGRMPGD